ncbi:MAG: metallopeptidase family protein [Chloroflexi bacterium]|nr:metallopeptidase family protein [Chloroflexota bacterium]
MDEKSFDHAVKRALRELPDEFRKLIDNVEIDVRDEPDAEMKKKLAPRGELLGLYQGVPLVQRGIYYSSMPDRVLLFRGPIHRICRDQDEVVMQIKATLIHEIGHYFGLKENEMPR